MKLFAKVVTAARGSAREAVEVVVDANALRIFEQEIHDCEETIQEARRDLSSVIAEKLKLRREIDSSRETIARRESEAAKALQQGNEILAYDIAKLIAAKQHALKEESERFDKLEAYEMRMQQNLRAAAQKLTDYRNELRMAHATASAQRASRKLASDTTSISSRIIVMQSSLERIRERQENVNDHLEAAEQIERSTPERELDARIVAAGIVDSEDTAEVVLARIRKTVQND